MALTGELKKDPTSGKEEFIAKFTNGTVEQLKELKKFLQKEGIDSDEDLTKVIETALAFLLKLKVDKEQEFNQ